MKSQRTKNQQVSDALWEAVAPHIPPEPPKPKGGRPPVPPRKALGGILLVLRSGIGWQELTTEMGFGSGSTCWRRLAEWQAAGVWSRLHRVLLDRLGDADTIDWSRVSVDGSSVAAKRGARRPGKVHADKGYDFGVNRRALRARHIIPRIARRGIESKERLGRYRWVVERDFAWLNQFKRLAVRYERRADIHEAFLHLGCSLICLNAEQWK